VNTWIDVSNNKINLVNGINTIYIRTTDEAGSFDNEKGVSYTINTETTMPTLAITSVKTNDGVAYKEGTRTNKEIAFTLSSSGCK